MAVQHIGHTLSGIAGGFVAVLVVLDGADLDRVHAMTAAGSIATLVFIISELDREKTGRLQDVSIMSTIRATILLILSKRKK